MFFKTKFSSCYSHVWFGLKMWQMVNISTSCPLGHIWLRPEHETSRSSPVSELWFVSCIFGYTDMCCIYTVLELAVSALLWEWSYLCFWLLEFTAFIAEMSKLYWTVHSLYHLIVLKCHYNKWCKLHCAFKPSQQVELCFQTIFSDRDDLCKTLLNIIHSFIQQTSFGILNYPGTGDMGLN